jgi:hypothetical protein
VQPSEPTAGRITSDCLNFKSCSFAQACGIKAADLRLDFNWHKELDFNWHKEKAPS